MNFVTCPHCGGTVEIVQVNCAIFRHGVFKRDGTQMPPHATKTECDELIKTGAIQGCGRPFRVVRGGEAYRAVVDIKQTPPQ